MDAYDWVTTEPPRLAQLSGVESDGDDVFAVGDRGLLLERRGPARGPGPEGAEEVR